MSPYHMVTERPVRKLSKGSKGTHMHIVDCGGSGGGGVVSVCGVYVSLSVCIYMFFFHTVWWWLRQNMEGGVLGGPKKWRRRRQR